MRIKPRLWLFIFLSTACAARASDAQTPDRSAPASAMSSALAEQNEGPPLSLADALRQAVENNRDLVVARRQVDPLRPRVLQARALSAPTFEGQIWQWPIGTTKPANADMYMFTASQELTGREKRAALAKLAETDVKVGEASVTTGERDVIAEASDAYWRLLIARRAIAIHLQNVALLHELTDVAQAKYAAGRIPQQDVLKAIVETTMLHDDLIELEQQAAESRARLNALMNRSFDTPIGHLDERGESVVTASVADLQTLAIQSQPDLQVRRVQIERAKAQQEVSRTTGLREWSVGGGYMLRPQQADAWTARLAMSWPGAPWARSATRARVAEAAADLNVATAEIAAADVRVRLDVTNAYLRVKAAEERAVLVRTTLLPQSRQALDVSRISYEADRLDFLAVVENERALLDAELRYEGILDQWRRAFSDLERAVGTTLPATMIRSVLASEAQR